MRVPGFVMDAVRGLGGVVLISAAAGCGSVAMSSDDTVTTPARVVLAQEHTPPVVKPDPHEVEAWPEEVGSYPDVHPACGRG